jgi:putative membrane protein
MLVRWLLAAVHLLALAIGFGAVLTRSLALRQPLDAAGVRRVLAADSWWGIAALIWIASGVARAFGGFEKGTQYYLQNYLFQLKMGLFLLILLLELGPMIAFVRWRIALARGAAPDTGHAGRFTRISALEAFIVLVMVFVANAMARGFGAPR